jgi:hypothetical protein
VRAMAMTSFTTLPARERSSVAWARRPCLRIMLLLSLCATGCSPEVPRSRVDKLVEDLGDVPFGPMSLGAARPYPNDITEELIGFRELAVPALVRALEGENPVRVGFAAYCLQRMKIDTGVPAAKIAMQRYMKKTKPYASIEVRFAILGLREYISVFEDIPLTPF